MVFLNLEDENEPCEQSNLNWNIYLRLELSGQPDGYILVDHLEDQTEQSNPHQGCRDLWQLRLYKAESQSLRYKIGKKSMFVWSAFVSPEKKIQKIR